MEQHDQHTEKAEEKKPEHAPEQKHEGKNWHDKHYKTLLIIPAVLLLVALVYLFIFYSNHHDIFNKDISLTGGTSATVYTKLDIDKVKTDLSSKLDDISTREIFDLVTNEQKAIVIQTKTDADTTKKVLEEYLGYKLDASNSSFEYTGATLSKTFYNQLLFALLLAFVFMAIVVFILFRTLVPSFAVIFSAFADIVMTLFAIDLFGMKMSSAGIVAVLMLIGYSVDTDILLTNRVLKRHEDTLNHRLLGAFKTGMTMTLTAIASLGIALFIVRSLSPVLAQILTVLLIGLFFDMLNTWITNVSILKWYAHSKEGKEAK
ncbi:MAG: protein translocase subunit SecF [Nanoarchaeota archaeon]